MKGKASAMRWQKLDQRGLGYAALGVVEHAVHTRKQFQAVKAACSSGNRIGKRKGLQPEDRQHLAAAMNRDLNAVRKRVESNVNNFAVATEFRNRFAANVTRGPGQLRARLRLKPRVYRLKFHGRAKHSDKIPTLLQVKHYAYTLI